MIEPTIGRVVLVVNRQGVVYPDFPEAALITYVHGDRCINVAGFDHMGDTFSLRGLVLVQDDDTAPSGVPFAEWMVYQKGQAAKTEQLEAQLRAGGSA